MIKDRINPQLRKRFLQEIKKTKETDKERGFHICIEDNGKLSAGETCVGESCSLKFQNVNISCPGKKVQGDFHTHPHLAEMKKSFGIRFKASKELMNSTKEIFLEERGITSTIPSHADILSAILGKCAKRTEGTTCVGSDLEENKIECWTIKNQNKNVLNDADCVRAYIAQFSDDREGLPKEWVKPLFDIEKIKLINRK